MALGLIVGKEKCHCTCKRASPDHMCPVHHQLLVLHYMGLKQVPLLPTFTMKDSLELWEYPTTRAELTQNCVVCHEPCGDMKPC